MERVIEEIRRRKLTRDFSLLGFFQNYPVEKYYQEGNSYLILGKSDHLWAYPSSDNQAELEQLMEQYQYDTGYFASVEEWMKPIIINKHEMDWELKTNRYILPEEREIPPAKGFVVELTEADATYIYDNSAYQQFTSIDYIKERIERGSSAGIFRNGKLVAWGLTHDDNALGFLNVLPEYRRQGYAVEISRSLLNKQRKEGKQVFLNIEPTNLKSTGLAKKLGFIFDRQISWIKIK